MVTKSNPIAQFWHKIFIFRLKTFGREADSAKELVLSSFCKNLTFFFNCRNLIQYSWQIKQRPRNVLFGITKTGLQKRLSLLHFPKSVPRPLLNDSTKKIPKPNIATSVPVDKEQNNYLHQLLSRQRTDLPHPGLCEYGRRKSVYPTTTGMLPSDRW